MSFELVLFILVAAVAIFSAGLMLVSRNAVHSALFLVINLLCVAFFYLMLNAPFLAMVQITVYAGAIMVLFMFVIMLLGSERLGGVAAKYKWIPVGAMILTAAFLVVAFLAIRGGNISLLKAVPPAPEIRFVHTVASAPEVDVYLNNDRVVSKLANGETTSLAAVKAGQYNLSVFAACEDADQTKCDPFKSNAPALIAKQVDLKAESVTTFILAGTTTQAGVVAVPTDLSTLADDTTFRLTVVNAMPGTGPLTLYNLTPGTSNDPQVMVPALAYGAASQSVALPRGNYSFEWRQGDVRLVNTGTVSIRGKVNELLILVPQPVLGSGGAVESFRPSVLRVEPALRTEEAFGSPMQIGTELLTSFLLPFELVALLLLTSMVGAIILVREEVIRRERKRLVVSPIVKRINRAAAENAVAVPVLPVLPVLPNASQPEAEPTGSTD